MPQVGDWILEECSTVGQGPLQLTGPVASFCRFNTQITNSTVWYSIEDNGDREVGIGTFDGTSTLQRTDIRATLKQGVYEENNPSPLFLSGSSIVGCTINSRAFVDIFDHIDNTANPHNVIASQITYDSSIDPVTNFTNLQDAMLDQSESIEERVATKSGIKNGGFITQAGPALVNVSAGEGLIIDSYTDPENTTVTVVNWTAKTGVALNIGSVTTGLIRFGIDSAGNLLQFTGDASPSQFRQYIILGSVFFINSVITEVNNTPSVIKQTATDCYDLMRALVIANGFTVNPVTGLLSVWLTEGSVFYPGINWYNDKTNPNNITLPQEGDINTALSFYVITQDGTITGPQTTIPKFYNPSGSTQTALSGSNATIHRFYSFGLENREFVILMGQTQYNNALNAKANVFAEMPVIPAELDSASFLAYIGIQQNATNFSNPDTAWIISTITSGGASGSGSTQVDHTTLTNRDAADQHPIDSIGEFGGEQLRDYLDDAVYQTPAASQTITLGDGNPILVLEGSGTISDANAAFVVSNGGDAFSVLGDGTALSEGYVGATDGFLSRGTTPEVFLDQGGIQIDTLANANIAGIFRASNVAHGMTALFPTDVYWAFGPEAPNNGGMTNYIMGGEGILFNVSVETANTVLGIGAVAFAVAKADGVATQALAANEAAMTVNNGSNIFALWGDGSLDLGGTLSVGGDLTTTGDFQAAGIIAGDPGTEGSGINIGGVTYDSALKVSDIGGSDPAQFIMHRHSTTLQPVLIGARSNSNTTAHAAVVASMALMSMYGCGWTGAEYNIFSSIDFGVSSSGTISDTSSPGRITLGVTQDGNVLPTPVLTLDSDLSAIFAGDINVSGDLNVTGATNLSEISNGTSSVEVPSVDGPIDFFTAGSRRLRITGTGVLSTGGETAPDALEGGITLYNASSGSRMLTFKNPAVAHGATSIQETDTYGVLGLYHSSEGGLSVLGLTETARGLALEAMAAAPNVGNSFGVVHVNARKISGTSITALGLTENLFSLHTNSSTPVFRVTGAGTVYTGGGGSSSINDGGIHLDTAGNAYQLLMTNTSVAHGITSQVQTDANMYIRKLDNTAGGVWFRSFSSGNISLMLDAIVTGGYTGPYALGAIALRGAQKSGTTAAQLGSTNVHTSWDNNGTVFAAMRADGQLYLSSGIATGGETAPDASPGGLCLQQNDENGKILTFKSTSINHGMTSIAETDTYGVFQKLGGTSGGLLIRGFSAVSTGIIMTSHVVTPNTTSSYGSFAFVGAKKSGTTTAAMASTERLFTIHNSDSNSPKVIVFGNGDTTFLGQVTDYNTYNSTAATSYTPVLSDASKFITTTSASAVTVTIPANATTAFPVGTKLNFLQAGTGQLTIAITTDTLNVNSTFTKKLSGQYSVATAIKTSTTAWVLFGDLEPA